MSEEQNRLTQHWSKTWIAVAFMATVLISCYEGVWRLKGHRPSVLDGADLWSYHRDRVYEKNGKTVVLLGASRMQLGFATAVFGERFPDYSITQLAVNGSLWLPTLRDLANDRRFNGIVICSTVAHQLARQSDDHNLIQQQYIDYYHSEWTLSRKIDTGISAWLQSRLIVMQPRYAPQTILSRLRRTGKLQRPFYVITNSDRSRSADYSMLDADERRSYRMSRIREAAKAGEDPIKPDAWLAKAMETEDLVQRIHSRGGKVVLVRFPTTGEHLALSEQGYPKKLYWDQFARNTEAVVIHFMDVPTLANFDCPDTSHLNYRDALLFTGNLLDELVRLEVLEVAEYAQRR